MKLHNLKLFYSPFCNICPIAKEVVREIAFEKKIPLNEINIFSPKGEKIAETFHVKSVPCLIIDDVDRIDGVPTKEQIETYLNA